MEIPIFKSPQEEEFFSPLKKLSSNKLTVPNAPLSSVINNKVLDKLEGNNKCFFLSTSMDLVIVDLNTKLPIYFFEFDRKFHDEPDQKRKDRIKNKLIEEAGFKSHRIRKRTYLGDTNNYITLLEQIIQNDAKPQ